jgi:glycosyltransferase involved in cell wall biosynthesis
MFSENHFVFSIYNNKRGLYSMKALVISNLYPPNAVGGAERLTETLTCELKKRHSVYVLTSKADVKFPSYVIPKYKLWNNYPDPIANKPIRQMFISWYNLIVTLTTIITKKPDVILISDIKRLGFGPVIISQYLKPTVVFIHDLHSFNIPPRITGGYKKHIKNFLNRLRLFCPIKIRNAICNSNSTLNLQPDSIKVLNAEIVGVGIKDSRSQYPSTKTKKNLNYVQLIYLGRIEKDKGVHDIIEAMNILKTRNLNKEIYLNIAGYANDLNYIDDLKKVIHKLKLDEHITITGQVDEKTKFALLYDADVFVFSSTWKEGHGQTYLEAMLCKTPCVCSAVGGVKECLIDAENCYLFPPGNHKKMADAICKVLDDPVKTQSIVSEASKMVVEKYLLDSFYKRCENAIMKALNR